MIFDQEEARIRRETFKAAASTSDARKNPELTQTWLRAKQKLAAVQHINKFASRNRTTSLLSGSYSVIPRDIREQVMLDDYIARKRRYIRGIIDEERYKKSMIEEENGEELPTPSIKRNPARGPRRPKSAQKRYFKIIPSKKRVRKLIERAESLSKARFKVYYAEDTKRLKNSMTASSSEPPERSRSNSIVAAATDTLGRSSSIATTTTTGSSRASSTINGT
jgi:hypothetical protein